MVTAVATPVLRRSAEKFFRSDETPEEFQWIERLSPLHSRLFAVDLHAALSNVLIHKDDGEALRRTLEDWQATADVDANPELAKKLRTPREKKKYVAWRRPK